MSTPRPKINTRSRSKNGAMMGIIIACTLVFVILVVALVQIGLLFGGSREVSNAVDAGTLNTGLKAPTVTVDTQGGDEGQYNDVAENGKSFSLKSINRMWAKCLVCMMNEQEMENDGYSQGQSHDDAETLYSAAKSISDRLAQKLDDPNSLKGFFNSMVSNESVKMLGNSAGVTYESGGGWATSLMDRKVESNVAIYPEQLPVGDLSTVNAIKASNGTQYFKGYEPVKVLDHYVTFVPFQLNSQPHLVSRVTFEANMASKSAVSNYEGTPVPNAFSCQGKTTSQHLDTQHARSFVLSNPQKTFDFSIPHSFIKINLGTNTCHFWCNAAPYPIYDQTYGYFPATPYVCQSGPMDGGAGVCTATLTGVGSEFLPPTIWQALTPTDNYGGSYNTLKKVLTQRCAEMKHGFTESDLESTLSSMLLPTVTDYYIYPDDSGDVVVSPSVSHPIPPSWVLTGGSADGVSEKEIDSNGESAAGIGPVVPPFVVEVEYEGIGGGSGVVMECDSVKWTAGTGYNGCLGEVKVTHELEAYCIAAGFI